MKKITAAALLAALLVIPALFGACAGGAGDDQTNTGDGTSPEVTTVPETESLYDADGYLKDKIPDSSDYGGITVNLLACSGQAKQFYVDPDAALSGDALKNELFTRMTTVEDRLGIKLNFIMEPGSWNEREAFIGKVDAAVKNGSGDYDVVIAYNLNPPVMATNGLLANLANAPHLDFSNPWYATGFTDTVSVDGRIFFAVNNSDYGSIRNMACVMFDKSLTSRHSIADQDLYKTVISREWTFGKLRELIAGTYEEANGDSKKSYGDIFGLAVVDAPRLDSLFYGAGLRIVGKDPDGSVVMQLGNEKVQNTLEEIVDLVYKTDDVYGVDTKMYDMFKNHQAMFYVTPIAIVDQKLDFDFGVMPVPMLNADQKEYSTYMSNTHESWCVPAGVLTYDAATDVIEAFGSYAYRGIAPLYFETMLKYRYSSDDSASQVYDIIRADVVFDFGYMFGNSFSTNPFVLFRTQVTNQSTNWTTLYKKYSSNFDRELGEIISKLAGQQG